MFVALQTLNLFSYFIAGLVVVVSGPVITVSSSTAVVVDRAILVVDMEATTTMVVREEVAAAVATTTMAVAAVAKEVTRAMVEAVAVPLTGGTKLCGHLLFILSLGISGYLTRATPLVVTSVVGLFSA